MLEQLSIHYTVASIINTKNTFDYLINSFNNVVIFSDFSGDSSSRAKLRFKQEGKLFDFKPLCRWMSSRKSCSKAREIVTNCSTPMSYRSKME